MSEQNLKVFRYLAAAAASDGVIDDMEKDLLLAGAQELGLTPVETAPIIELALVNKRDLALPPLGPGEDDETLSKVCEILLADGVMQRAEHRFLDRLQLVFSLDQNAVDREVNKARKRLSVMERTQSGRLKRSSGDERARRLPADAECVYEWAGGRAALSKDALLVFYKERHDREVKFTDVKAVHLEVDDGACCATLDVHKANPVTITDEGSSVAGNWPYVTFITHLHDRLQRARPGNVDYLTGDAKRYRRVAAYLALDTVVGGSLIAAAFVGTKDEPEIAIPLTAGLAIFLVVVIVFHVLALRSQKEGRYDPREGLPAAFLPGGSHETDKTIVLTALLIVGWVALNVAAEMED